MAENLKAYMVREPDEGSCCIVFATSSVVARREGANELNIDFAEVDSCTRARWADSYAPGPVPIKAMIEVGNWRYGCQCGCGRSIDNEGGIPDYDLDGDDGDLNPMQPVYVNGGVYWNQRCKDNDERKRREREEAKARDQAEVGSAVLAKFPFATEIKAYRGFGRAPGSEKPTYDVLTASFAFPGGEGHASWFIGDDHVWVRPGDVPAWNAVKAGKGVA